MESVVIGGIVVVLHVEPCGLTLDQVADIVYQTLPQHVVVHRVEGGHNTVNQEYSTHGQKVILHMAGSKRHLAAGGDSYGNGINEQLEEIEIE